MHLAAVLAIFAIAFVPVRAGGADDLDLLIDKALNLSGLKAQLEALPAAIASAVPDEAFPAGTKRNQSKERIGKPIEAQTVQVPVRDAIRRHCDSDVLQRVVEFYGTGLGRKVGRLQRSALSESTLKGIREGWKITLSLDAERLALIKRLVRANDVPRRNARRLKAAIQGLAEGASASGPPASTAEKVEEVGKAIRSLERTTQDTALVAFAYTFRSLRDGELEELTAFHESEPAMRFAEAVQEGVEDAVRRIARGIGESRRRQLPDFGEKGLSPSTK